MVQKTAADHTLAGVWVIIGLVAAVIGVALFFLEGKFDTDGLFSFLGLVALGVGVGIIVVNVDKYVYSGWAPEYWTAKQVIELISAK